MGASAVSKEVNKECWSKTKDGFHALTSRIPVVGHAKAGYHKLRGNHAAAEAAFHAANHTTGAVIGGMGGGLVGGPAGAFVGGVAGGSFYDGGASAISGENLGIVDHVKKVLNQDCDSRAGATFDIVLGVVCDGC